MKKKTTFEIDIFQIDQPLYIVGRTVRVTHGTPECFPAIDALCQTFDDDDVTAAIPDKAEPVIPFGVCSDHISHGGDIIEFTYMKGVQVRECPDDSQLPKTTLCHTIPAGDYVRIRVSAPSFDAGIGTAYIELDRWESPEWENCDDSGYEVFTSRRYNPENHCFDESLRFEMEKWGRVRRKA